MYTIPLKLAYRLFRVLVDTAKSHGILFNEITREFSPLGALSSYIWKRLAEEEGKSPGRFERLDLGQDGELPENPFCD